MGQARSAGVDRSADGLANRRAFSEQLIAELARAKRYDRDLSVVLLDLDHFKRINDEHGHQAGDRALIYFAQLLQTHSREGEFTARMGGEEFAWIIPETDEAGAYVAADRVRKALENDTSLGLGALTVSAGLRSAQPTDDADTLVDYADQALYPAKDGGRNRVFVYSEQALTTLSQTAPAVPA